jgi:hypothetical protein
MPDPTHFDPQQIRITLDHGDAVELDGGTLTIAGELSPSVVLRLAPWRARLLSVVLSEWSAASKIFATPPLRGLTEMDLARVLELASAVLGAEDPIAEPERHKTPGSVPSSARLAAVAVLNERESRLSAIQKLALVDAAAWWLGETTADGPRLAQALLEAACTSGLAAQDAYIALIQPPPSQQPE